MQLQYVCGALLKLIAMAPPVNATRTSGSATYRLASALRSAFGLPRVSRTYLDAAQYIADRISARTNATSDWRAPAKMIPATPSTPIAPDAQMFFTSHGCTAMSVPSAIKSPCQL